MSTTLTPPPTRPHVFVPPDIPPFVVAGIAAKVLYDRGDWRAGDTLIRRVIGARREEAAGIVAEYVDVVDEQGRSA